MNTVTFALFLKVRFVMMSHRSQLNPIMNNAPPVLTVSQITRQIKGLLEFEVGNIRVEGEVSNLSLPASGHSYFTLKDSGAQLRCVFFKSRFSTQAQKPLKEGQKIIVQGQLSVYEARGDLQMIVNQWSESGLGELYQRFLALKQKLEQEGLFNPERKKALPRFPERIGLITSPTGAAIRDMLTTLNRRYPCAEIRVYPCEVQGATAAGQLVKALQRAARDQYCDVLILARGGGSIEDLWAFNEEILARQMAVCPIPIVSGVGHETDFTIADFVADLRAATPTAAAEAVTPNQAELLRLLLLWQSRLQQSIRRVLQHQQLRLTHLDDKLTTPRKMIYSHWQKLDYLQRQCLSLMRQILLQRQQRCELRRSQLAARHPRQQIQQALLRLSTCKQQLRQAQQRQLDRSKDSLQQLLATLHAVSPLATLDRGYAIATRQDQVLRNSHQVHQDDEINIRLAQGQLTCQVTAIRD